MNGFDVPGKTWWRKRWARCGKMRGMECFSFWRILLTYSTSMSSWPKNAHRHLSKSGLQTKLVISVLFPPPRPCISFTHYQLSPFLRKVSLKNPQTFLMSDLIALFMAFTRNWIWASVWLLLKISTMTHFVADWLHLPCDTHTMWHILKH